MRRGQVRFLQGQADRLKEKLQAAERSAAASLAQKARLPSGSHMPLPAARVIAFCAVKVISVVLSLMKFPNIHKLHRQLQVCDGVTQ